MAIVTYCNAEDVKTFLQTEMGGERAEIIERLSGDRDTPDARIDTKIEEQSADITATMGSYYDTPLALSSDVTVKILNMICVRVVCYDIVVEIWRDSAGDEVPPYVKAWLGYARHLLEKYTGGFLLPGETISDPTIVTDATDDEQEAFRPRAMSSGRKFDNDANYRGDDVRRS